MRIVSQIEPPSQRMEKTQSYVLQKQNKKQQKLAINISIRCSANVNDNNRLISHPKFDVFFLIFITHNSQKCK